MANFYFHLHMLSPDWAKPTLCRKRKAQALPTHGIPTDKAGYHLMLDEFPWVISNSFSLGESISPLASIGAFTDDLQKFVN
jgi:hypothetical protein